MYESGDDGKVLSSSAVTKDNIVCLPSQGKITEQFTKKCGTLNAVSEQRTHLHMWTGSRTLYFIGSKLQEIQESGEKKPRKMMKQKGDFIS